jgi:hypothetical protein
LVFCAIFSSNLHGMFLFEPKFTHPEKVEIFQLV